MLNICFEATKKCNLSCRYCISADNPAITNENENTHAILERISTLKPDRLVISGGEPLLDNKLIEELVYIKQNMPGTYVSLSTNAADSYEFELLEELVDCIDISLPSLNEHTYKEMRGIDRVANVKHNIIKCVEKGFNVRISCTLTKLNKGDIIDLLDFFSGVGVNSVRLGRYLPLRNANACKDEFELDNNEIESIIAKVNEKKYHFTIIPPIKDIDVMTSGYITINYNGELFIPKENGKDIILNVLTCSENELESRLNELSIQDIQSEIFLNSEYQKYNFSRYFTNKRIRFSDNSISIFEALHSDRSRIIFSSPFRRLQQKAQVFSLEPNSNVRSRLTHSLEVSDAGKRIAVKIVEAINKKTTSNMDPDVSSYLINVVENACLLHDIGNPPFGHFGEKAIKIWWSQNHNEYIKKYNRNANTRKEINISFSEHKYLNLLKDFEEFDGNPQGLRIALRLYNVKTNKDDFKENNEFESGFNLTYSTILCSLKYIRAAGLKVPENASKDIIKKAGYFNSERRIIQHVRDEMKIRENSRYPFVYLMEAADDIAYCLSDISDGFEKNIFRKKEFVDLLNNKLENNENEITVEFDYAGISKLIDNNNFDFNYHISSPLANIMINEVSQEFVNNIVKYLNGNVGPIISKKSTPKAYKLLKVLKEISTSKLYRSAEAETIELAGYAIINGLLKCFGCLLELTYKQFDDFVQGKYSPEMNLEYEYRLYNRLSKRFIKSYLYQRNEWKHYIEAHEEDYGMYEIEWWLRAHLIVDHISSMTDEYALKAFQTCQGINIEVLN